MPRDKLCFQKILIELQMIQNLMVNPANAGNLDQTIINLEITAVENKFADYNSTRRQREDFNIAIENITRIFNTVFV